MTKPIMLSNSWLTACFGRSTGNLEFLAASQDSPTLIRGCACRYYDGVGWITEDVGDSAAPGFRTVQVRHLANAVESVIESSLVRIFRLFELKPDQSTLACELRIEPLDPSASLQHAALPRIVLPEDFNDIFEDEEDLYFDGEELPGGSELPCWRVLFRTGRSDGLIVATRSKRQMSHVQFQVRGFDLRPHVMTAYSQHMPLQNTPLDFTAQASHVAQFEIGPWRRDRHAAILADARLGVPVDTKNPPAEGDPMPQPAGIVLDFCDLVPPGQVHADCTPDTWRVEPLPFCLHGRALYAGPGTHPPDLRVAPSLTGAYRVFVGIGQGDGAALSAPDDPLPSYRLRPAGTMESTPFMLRLSGRHQAHEVDFGIHDLEGKEFRIGRHPGEFAVTVLDYIRFEALGESEARAWRERQAARPRIPLSGFNDIPDIAYSVAGTPEAFESNLRDHARCGIGKVYWRIDGQCSDFPSRHNTMRYVSAKTHDVFTPMMKAYGRLLQRRDVLALAVEAGRKYGLEIYGWMRFNHYGLNVQSDFFRKNPRYHEELDSGAPAPKLCLAFPEVRKHKIDILVEAAAYGLQGLSLGFLRAPPILTYAPILVEGYTRQYGVPPPRDPAGKDRRYIRGLPPDDDEHRRWFQYRADFMTLFGRELKEALAAQGLARVKVSLWVRPNHCLFDGIDLPAWLKEGLCDEVVADDFLGVESWPSPEWKAMVQGSARLYRGVTGFDFDGAQTRTRRAIDEGYDGISVYESNQAVLDSRFIAFFNGLRGPSG
jgi:hypothetical protein